MLMMLYNGYSIILCKSVAWKIGALKGLYGLASAPVPFNISVIDTLSGT